ncbi:MAG TPA: hypothetical protein VIK14_00500 [Ignavibacteria bacterium]
MKISLTFLIILICLNLTGFNYDVNQVVSNINRDTCSYIDYGTKNINIWTPFTDIFNKYGKIESNCNYGHGRGYAYFDPDKKVFLIFGYMDGGAEQIVIAKESAVNITKKSICNLSTDDITSKKGVKLGMQKNEVRSILGEPSVETDNTLEYYAMDVNCIIDGKSEYILVYEGIYTFESGNLIMIDLANSD